MKRVAIVSIQPPFPEGQSPEANEKMTQAGFGLLEEALKHGAAFCCLPEYFNVFGVENKDVREVSSNGRAMLDRAKALARRYSSYIILPMIVPERDRYYNRAYLIDDEGAVAGFYDKAHLTVGERDDLGLSPGNDVKLFDTNYGRVAVVICYDVYFPELFSTIALDRPEVIFFPSLQRSEHETASEAMLRTRAMDSQAYLVRSSYGCPSDRAWRKDMMFGQSCIVHPDGTILANAGHYEGFAVAHVILPFVWRRQRCGDYPAQPVREFLREDRRSDVYRM